MKSKKRDFRHPLYGTSITNWFRLLVENGGVYKIDSESIAKVDKHWGFTVERWRYKPLS